MKATIWHNPRCSKSREALELLHQESGTLVIVFEYLKTAPTVAKLSEILFRTGLTAQDLARHEEEIAMKHGTRAMHELQLLKLMSDYPILIQRPIVETDKGVRLARPAERVREIL